MDPRIAYWPGQGDTGVIRLASEPLGGQAGNNMVEGTVGVGMAFAREYLKHVSSDRSVLLVPTGIGATGLVSGPWAVGGSAYNAAVAQANAAITAATATGATVNVAAILWLQGEDDSGSGRTQAQYATALDATIGGFRSSITNATNAYTVVGPMVNEWRTGPNGTSLQVHAAHVDTPNRLTRAVFVDGPGTGYGQDSGNIHWNSAGMRYIGKAMAQALFP